VFGFVSKGKNDQAVRMAGGWLLVSRELENLGTTGKNQTLRVRLQGGGSDLKGRMITGSGIKTERDDYGSEATEKNPLEEIWTACSVESVVLSRFRG